MSYLVTTGYRMQTYSFATSDEAKRFNEEYFVKNGIRGSISKSDSEPVYRYTSDAKLVRM